MNYKDQTSKNLLLFDLKIIKEKLIVFMILGVFFIPQQTFAITPVITWENPADVVYGTALSEIELNAITDVDGEFFYAPALGTVLNAGMGQILSVTFIPTDIDNYEIKTDEVLINVTQARLNVTADDKTKEYGTHDPPLTYTYSGLVNGDIADDVFSGVLEREPGELGGDYDINQGTLGANSNYIPISNYYSGGRLSIEDTVVATVVSHTPLFNSSNISTTTSIVVTFSEAVDIDQGGYVLFSPEISGGYTITNSGTSVITITPNNPLAENTIYTVTINDIADINGTLLETYNNIKFATAQSPSLPHQFFGSVNFVNGASANELIVEAKINDAVVGSSITFGNNYGYNPNLFFALDNDGVHTGKTVEFYVSGVKANETAVFVNGGSSQIDLTIPILTVTSGGGRGAPSTGSNTSGQKVDANKDNKIDILDFNVLMVNWGRVSANNTADLNSDSKVDILDFNVLMVNWIF